MYYYGGYSGTTNSCGCNNVSGYAYPMYGYGYSNGSSAAIVLVLFILLVIILGSRTLGNN